MEQQTQAITAGAADKKQPQQNPKNKDSNNDALYTSALFDMKVVLLPMEIGESITKDNLKNRIAYQIEGKCVDEGWVKPNSIKIQSHSNGLVKGEYIEFTVIFECQVCNPVEGTWLKNCEVKSITKAGIHVFVYDDARNIPCTVFIARDHFIENKYFQSIKEKDIITVKIIGTRFELNSKCIDALGSLIIPSKV